MASEESRLKRLGDNYIENGLQPLYIQDMYLQMDILYRLHLVPVLDALLLHLTDQTAEKGDISSESYMLHTVSYARPRPFALQEEIYLMNEEGRIMPIFA